MGQQTASTIWTTKAVNEALEKLRLGESIDSTCFHEKDYELRAQNIFFQLTPEEEDEFVKCSNDVEYFVENHCRFTTDQGKRTVPLRDFQSDILNTIGGEVWLPNLKDFGPKVRNYILMASRQIGKTTTIAAFFAWYLCFHTDRNLLIIANKQQTTTEIVDKVVQVFRGLPFFLKPGIRTIQALGLRLDNGCNLYSQATTKTASIGFTIHVLYIDEFAHIHPKTVRSFWRSVYPTLSSSEISQCIISSTPDGMDNLFYELWDKANKGLNSFVYKRVDYWEVEGHDDAWAEKMKSDFGEEEFAQEFELSFDRKSNLLLSGSQLSWLKRISRHYIYKELEKTELDELLFRDKMIWHPSFDPNIEFDPKKYRFILSNDIAEGKDEEELKDNDYNVTSIYSVELKSLAKLRKLRKDEKLIQNMFRIKQIGLFKDNIGDEEIMAKVNQALVFDHFGEDLCKLVTEVNFNGKAFLRAFANHDSWNETIVMHSFHTAPITGEREPRKKPGYKTKSDKDFFCRLGKKLIGNKTLISTDKETLSEFGSFGKVKSSWKGIAKHDDTVMACLNISRFYMESEYADWLYDFLEDIEDSPVKRYAQYLLEEPYEDNETSDSMFSALYLDSDQGISESEKIREIFTKERTSRYKPGNSFHIN
jgi:hypothetical protein